jgi:hypothetical protein
MCKDQHGCRFLQKKLDEENPQVVDAIFNEVYPHFAELMTDPFGNYLCQKLLEHCGEKQRLMLIESVASDLVRISQNMHGTRAVQKMIECLRNPQEVLHCAFNCSNGDSRFDSLLEDCERALSH